MRLIERYVLRRAAVMVFATLLPLLGIVWTTQALTRINLVTDSGQSILAFMALATLILPTVLLLVLPFALAIGVSQTLAVMNSDSELTVLSAAGCSRMTIIRPVLWLGLALSFLSFAVDNVVEPLSRMSVRKMVAAANADLLSSVVQENTFRKIGEGLYVQVASRRPSGVLGGIFVADSRDPAHEFIYYAREGAVDRAGSALVMRDGEVHRKLPDGKISIIKFDSYAFDLTDMTRTNGPPNIQAKDRSLAYLIAPDPDDPSFMARPQLFAAELHRRFTEWSFPLVFAMVVLAVGVDARSHRESRLHPTISTLLICLLVRWAYFYCANKAEGARSLVILMYMIPAASGMIAAYQLVAREKLRRFPSTRP